MKGKAKKKEQRISRIIAGILLAFAILLFVLPLLLVISVSLTEESAIAEHGFQLIPYEFSLDGYKYIFEQPAAIIRAYAVTAGQAFLATFLSVVIMAMCSYSLSRKSFKARKVLMIFFLFTMLFHGGLIPTYILNAKYLHLKDNFWVYVLPGLVGAWYLIVMRTFFSQLPESLIDAAKIDGAKELRIFFQIIIPLSKPVLATVSLLILLDKWNDWMTSLIYINNPNLYSLQYMLQKILNEIEYVKQMVAQAADISDIDIANLPGENMRFAMSVVAAGPMMIVFPFFQKYFVKGLTVGSVKG